MILYHTTARAGWKPHIEASLTDRSGALDYGRGRGDRSTFVVDLDVSDLTVERVDMATRERRSLRDEQIYPGDADDPYEYDADVITFDDEDERGGQHTTFRLLTTAAVAAAKVIRSVRVRPEAEAAIRGRAKAAPKRSRKRTPKRAATFELAEEDPGAARVAADEENRARLLEEIDELAALAIKFKGSIPATEARAVQRRIRDLRKLAETPELIAQSFACDSRSGLVCEFPGIEEAKRSLRASGTLGDEGLDLPWENPRRSTRAPFTIRDGEEATDLSAAKILEVAAGGYVHRWTDGPTLMWFPRVRALVWYQGGARKGTRRQHDGSGPAANVARRWTWKGGGGEHAYDLHVSPPRGTWRALGIADRTDYSSTKDGQRASYTHEHGPGVTLYCLGGLRPPWVWALKGGRLKISKGGIEG